MTRVRFASVVFEVPGFGRLRMGEPCVDRTTGRYYPAETVAHMLVDRLRYHCQGVRRSPYVGDVQAEAG